MDTFITSIQTFLALAVVCGLAYFLFRVVMPRLNMNYSSNNMIRVVDRVAVDSRKSLCIVEVAGQWMMVAITENGVEKICDLNAEEAAVLEAEVKLARENQSAKVVGAGLVTKITELLGKSEGGK